MNRFIFSTILLFLFSIVTSFACSCIGDTTFCSTLIRDEGFAIDFPQAKPVLIVKGVKTEDYYYGIYFRVLEVIRGEEDREIITVWGDNGILCRQYVGGYMKTDTVILALHQTDLSGNRTSQGSGYPPDLEQESDYHLSVCGVYSLFVKNGNVEGPSTKAEIQKMPYEEWKQNTCLNIVSKTNKIPTVQLEIFPNPTDRFLFITSDQINLQKETNISVYNESGKEITFPYSMLNNQQLQINSGNFPAGIYFLVIQQEGWIRTERFVVLREN